MYFFIYFTVVQLVTATYGDVETVVAQAFRHDVIVSKVVLRQPTELIKVLYPRRPINLGTFVHPLQTLTKPQVSYRADQEGLYTLMFFGPDLPPSVVVPLTQFLHWLVVNIPGQDIDKGDTISNYFPPVPFPDGFPYIFLVYKQKRQLNATQIPNMSFLLRRPHFSITAFAKKYDLGEPLAGNFMHESYLEIVPETAYNILSSILVSN